MFASCNDPRSFFHRPILHAEQCCASIQHPNTVESSYASKSAFVFSFSFPFVNDYNNQTAAFFSIPSSFPYHEERLAVTPVIINYLDGSSRNVEVPLTDASRPIDDEHFQASCRAARILRAFTGVRLTGIVPVTVHWPPRAG